MRRYLPFILALVVFVLCGLCALCAGIGYLFWTRVSVPGPGAGSTADLGYQTCASIIAALERYHAQEGVYPATLDDLVPSYLVEAPPTPEGISEIRYRLRATSFELQFKYIGPGVNTCVYTPETGWTCSGYY
jgi:hypothetical protein